MMLYTTTLTTPPGTPNYAPVQAIIRPTSRHMIRAVIQFPPGTLGSVYARVLDYGMQLIPLAGWVNNDMDIFTDRWLSNPPYIVFETYSLARDWPHTITLQLDLI